jgi:hypothetical protein
MDWCATTKFEPIIWCATTKFEPIIQPGNTADIKVPGSMQKRLFRMSGGVFPQTILLVWWLYVFTDTKCKGHSFYNHSPHILLIRPVITSFLNLVIAEDVGLPTSHQTGDTRDIARWHEMVTLSALPEPSHIFWLCCSSPAKNAHGLKH